MKPYNVDAGQLSDLDRFQEAAQCSTDPLACVECDVDTILRKGCGKRQAKMQETGI
jgi:hypothetical protein